MAFISNYHLDLSEAPFSLNVFTDKIKQSAAQVVSCSQRVRFILTREKVFPRYSSIFSF